MTGQIRREVADQVARLFVAESESVFKVAYQAAWRDRGVAEDCVQESFQAAALSWDKISDYSPRRKQAWLCRVAVNKAIDRYRAGRLVDLAADVLDAWDSPSAEHIALTSMTKDQCVKVISEMPEIRRKVAYLKFHEEWTSGEIAELLGISSSTVRVHIHAARGMLDAAVGSEAIFIAGPDQLTGAEREEA